MFPMDLHTPHMYHMQQNNNLKDFVSKKDKNLGTKLLKDPKMEQATSNASDTIEDFNCKNEISR